MDAGLTAWSAYNAISGKDLLSGAHLSNGARIGYGLGVLASVAGPLVGKLIGKGLNKLAETPQVSKMLGKLSNGTELLKASKAGQVTSKLSGSLKNLGRKLSKSGIGKVLGKAAAIIMKPLNKANSVYEGAAEKIKGVFSKSEKVNSDDSAVIYRRVQKGQGANPGQSSQVRILVNKDGTITISEKGKNLNISVDNGEHSEYFLKNNRQGGEVVEFEMPKWFDNMVKEYKIEQKGAKSIAKDLPKEVDPNTPGHTYEFPAPWVEWIEEYAKSARIGKGGIL